MIIPDDIYVDIVQELAVISDVMLRMAQHVHVSSNYIMPEHIMIELIEKLNVAVRRQHAMLQGVYEGNRLEHSV